MRRHLLSSIAVPARVGRVALVVALAMILSACTFHVVGDSTMTAIEDANGGFGTVSPGCGYTGVIGYPAPCAIELTPPEQDTVVATVSVWDAGGSDLSAYSAAQAYYESFGATVIWVEVPPYNVWPWSQSLTDALNEDVADELDCDLVPWSIREVDPEFMVDPLHYTEEGAALVAFRFQQLGPADEC